jgi:hypothetical protein
MPTPEENPDLTVELQKLAQSHVDMAASKFGLSLDYSEESLRYVDDAISKHFGEGETLDETLLTHGAYVGETLRRKFGGVWVQDERGVALLDGVGGGNLKASPFSWVQARFSNGMADGLAVRFASFHQELQQSGPKPALAKPLAVPKPAAEPASDAPSEEDMKLITRAPLLVFLLVAAADGKIDKKEMIGFQKVSMEVMVGATPLLREAMSRLLPKIDEHLRAMQASNPVEQLERLSTVLDSFYAKEARTFKEQLMTIAIKIAESSGGFLGMGSKVSKDEKMAIAGIGMVLGLIEEEE